jgi:hypothetical protein
MVHDSDYFLRRAAEARAAACDKLSRHNSQVAGDLALAFSALARRHSTAVVTDDAEPAPQLADEA